MLFKGKSNPLMSWLVVAQLLVIVLMFMYLYPSGKGTPESDVQQVIHKVDSLRSDLDELKDLLRRKINTANLVQAPVEQKKPEPEPLVEKPAPSAQVVQTFTSPTNVALGKVLPVNARRDGALCLDGSPAGYYLRKGDPYNWVILLEGGGWCYNNKSCEERRSRFGFLGSMSDKPKEFMIKKYFGSGEATSNQDFYDWSHAMFVYCDGSSYTGDREDPLSVSVWRNVNDRDKVKIAVPLYFRGHRILMSNMKDLLENHGLKAAKRVIIAGHSSGGMGVIVNLDQLRALFDPSTEVVGLVDAGLFLDYRLGGLHSKAHSDSLQNGVQLWNASKHLNPRCLQQESEPWKCIFPGHVLKHVSTRVFFSQHKYDSWVVKNMLGLPWLSFKNMATPQDLEAIYTFGEEMDRTVLPFLSRKEVGLWLASCELGVHGEITYHHWIKHKIGGVSLREAFLSWLEKRCMDVNSVCTWKEECDWTAEYRKNMSLVEQGKLQKCLFKHNRWEVGSVLKFRGMGENCTVPPSGTG